VGEGVEGLSPLPFAETSDTISNKSHKFLHEDRVRSGSHVAHILMEDLDDVTKHEGRLGNVSNSFQSVVSPL
jgi:hypothetical protein